MGTLNDNIESEIKTLENETEKGDESSYTDSSDDESYSSDEEIKAPLELLGEFLTYVRQGNWKDAHKLCKMILIYEPENPIALQFLDTIAEKSKIEEELAEMSSSDEESSDDETESSSNEESDRDADDELDITQEKNDEEEVSSDEDVENITKTMKNALVFPHKELGIWKP